MRGCTTARLVLENASPLEGISAAIAHSPWQGLCFADGILDQRAPHRFAFALVLGALTALAAVEVRAQSAPALDDYLCARGTTARRVDRALRFQPRTGLSVRDRLIAAASLATLKLDVRKPVGLCVPAGAPGNALIDPATHLEAYGTRLTRTRPTQPRLSHQAQRVINRFGTADFRLRQIETVLVPSAAALDPAPSPSFVAATIDDFACYEAERLDGRAEWASATPLTLASGFGTLQWDVRAPTRLCFPADLEGADPSVPSHPTALACYRAKLTRTRPPQSSPFPRSATTSNRFGTERLTLASALELCVPSQVHGVGATPTPERTQSGPTPTPTVTPPPGFTLRVNPSQTTVDIGASAHFTATAVFENGDLVDFTERVKWITDGEIAVAPNVAGDRGRIDTTDGGQTVVSVLDEATGVTSTATGEDALLTVNWTLQRIELLPTEATRGKGESIRLRATGHFAGGFTRSIADRIIYASNNPGTALPLNAPSATDHSRILGVGKGTATISAVDPISGVSSSTSDDDVALTILSPLERCKILQAGPITIATEHDYQLTAHGFYEGGFQRVVTQQVQWSSDAPAVMQAPNTDGDRSRLHALEPGEAHVTATDSVTGVKCEGSVTFQVGEPQGFRVLYSAVWWENGPRRVGGSWHVRAVQSFPPPLSYKFVTQKVLFQSSNPAILAAPNVDGDRGRIEAVGGGTATITAVDPANGAVASGVTFRVLDGLTRLAVSHPRPAIGKLRFLFEAYSYRLEATGQFGDGPALLNDDDVTFVSNNPSVIEVFHAGIEWRVRAIGFGTATISAVDNQSGISSDAFGESLQLAAPGPLLSVDILPAQTTRRMGTSYPFTAIGHFTGGMTDVITQEVSYSSSDPTIVRAYDYNYPSRSTVDALAPGTAIISGTHWSGVSSHDSGGDATITVVGPLVRLRVEPSAVTQSVGRSFGFTAIGTDADGREINLTQDVTWSASDPTVAVAPNVEGNKSRIDTVGEGTTTVSAYDPVDDVSSTTTGDDATLTVSGILESLTLSAEQTQLTVGTPIQLTATGHLVGGDTINLTQQVEYTSSDPAIAKAENPPGDRSRILTLAPGTAIISARDPGTDITTTPSGTVTLTITAP